MATPCTVLNPFSLLGVSLDSTMQEVKKAYYELALVAHPDKGGSADQMRTVQSAYEYVSLQIRGIGKGTYEGAEEEFKRFCAEQTDAPHPFPDIFAEAFNLPTFNDLWARAAGGGGAREVDEASLPGGYGDVMVASDISGAAEYSHSIPDAPVPPMTRDVQLYEAPEPAVQPNVLVRDLTVPADAAVDDFSTQSLLDYRAAFAPLLPEGVPVLESTLTDASLEALIAARAIECPDAE